MICPRASRTTLGGRQYRLHHGPEVVREHPIAHHSKIITDDPAQDWQTRSSTTVALREGVHGSCSGIDGPCAGGGGAILIGAGRGRGWVSRSRSGGSVVAGFPERSGR